MQREADSSPSLHQYQQYYHRLKEQGLCVKCGNHYDHDGKGVCCPECRQKKAGTDKKRRTLRAEKWVCKICGTAPVEEGKLSCRECADKNNESGRAAYLKFINEGKCVNCGVYIGKTGIRRCPECARKLGDTQKRRNDMRKKEGICIDCKTPVTKGIRCIRCQEKSTKSRTKYRERNRMLGVYLQHSARAATYKTGEGDISTRLDDARTHNPDTVVVALTLISDNITRKIRHSEIKTFWGLNGHETFYDEQEPHVEDNTHKLFEIVNFTGIDLDEVK